MQIKDIMTADFKIIRPDTTLREAAQYMRDRDCGYLPVGENDRLQGAVTDRDIVVRGLAQGMDAEAAVESLMTQKVVYCFEDDDVHAAAEKMKREQIRRLVVLDRNKRMTGVVTVGDIARSCNDQALLGDIEDKVAHVA